MAIILSHRILKREFGTALPDDDREVLLRAARTDLATPIGGTGLPKGTRAYFLYLATIR